MPSIADNSPNTVYECLERGLPFIASNVGGIPELISSKDRVRVLFEPTPAGIAAALIGFAPRFAAAAWAFLAGFLLLSLVGSALRWNQAILDVSPFTHLARLPGGTFTVTPVIWLVLIALVAAAAGITALRRRDMPVG